MKAKQHEPVPPARSATDEEIWEACTAGRTYPPVWPLALQSEASIDDLPEATRGDRSFCELRSETGEWVQFPLFDLEFSAALAESPHRRRPVN